MAYRDYNRSQSGGGSLSWISGIQLKLADAFQPPAKVTLPLSYECREPPDHLFAEYDFALEEKVLEWCEGERLRCSAAATLAAESRYAAESGAAAESGLEVDSGAAAETPSAAESRLETDARAGGVANAPVAVESLSGPPPGGDTAVYVALPPPRLQPAEMLVPLPPIPAKAASARQVEPPETPFDPADFEVAGQDPFESAELRTLDDIEELNKLQLGVPAALQGEPPSCLPNGRPPPPPSSVAPSQQGTLQTVKDVSYPNLDAISFRGQAAPHVATAVAGRSVKPANQPPALLNNRSTAAARVNGSPSLAFKPDAVSIAPNGVVRCSFAPSLSTSRSSPEIHRPGDRAGVVAYTPPPVPGFTSPPPAEVPATQTSSRLPWTHPVAPLDVVDVPPMLPVVSTHHDDASHSANLSEAGLKVVTEVTDMGFARDRVVRAVQIFGADDKQVVECLCLVDRLSQQGYSVSDIETALQHLKAEESKVMQYLHLLGQFKEFGFEESRVKAALIDNDLDEDRILDCLTAT